MQKWSHEKSKLDDVRKLRGIYVIDFEDKEFEENHQECWQEIGTTSGSRHALQDKSEEQVWGKTKLFFFLL